MPKILSFASWNVEKFSNEDERVDRVVGLLAEKDPDVFALYEVTGKDVFNVMISSFLNYTFQITEGPQTQEILVGVRNTISAFITQRVEFKSGVTYMRPGLMVTINIDGKNYVLLFLHLASST